MADERKTIIVNEILHWKKNQLLPSKYCDFLLALYTQGEGTDTGSPGNSKRISRFSFIYVPVTIFLLPLSFLVIYFTEIEPILQTGLLSTFVTVSFFQVWWYKRKNNAQYHLPLIVGLLIGMLLSVSIIQEMFTNNMSIYIVVTMNCILWTWLGLFMRINYLTISGVVGFILLFLSIVL